MLRRILSIVLGLIMGSTVMSLAHGLLSVIKPIPEGLDQSNMEAMNQYIASFSFVELHLASLGHAIGAMAAGYVAAWFSRHRRFSAGMIAMLVFSGMTVINDVMLGYHWTDLAIDVMLNVLLGYLGAKVGSGMKIPFESSSF